MSNPRGEQLLDARGPQGVTALMLGAAKGHAAVVAMLLAAGANPHLETDSGASALLLAAREGHTQCVVELAKVTPFCLPRQFLQSKI